MSDVNFEYHCYRCGAKNTLTLPCPTAPSYHHQELRCNACGDGTRVLLSHCPSCGRYVFWINDLSIPDMVVGFATYMTHNMQSLIDRAAREDVILEVDTPDKYPLNAGCPCGTKFAIEIAIPDLD